MTLEEPLPYRRLASQMGALVWTPEEIPNLAPQCIQDLTTIHASDWSAATIEENGTTLVIVNSEHSEARRANDVMHELSHIILNHEPARVDLSEDGYLWLSSYDKDQEDEANWLGASLLLPRDGLLGVYKRKRLPEDLAEHFAVSVELVQWRINVTGIGHQVSRSSRRAKRA
jgi:Zn-dependent peptidase ImmA (M78 family)